MIKQLFGERIAVTESNFEFEGDILMPEGHQTLGKEYRLGEVVGVPDLVYFAAGEKKRAPMHYVELGDKVVFQIPAKITEGVQYVLPHYFAGKPFSIILQGDILGILKSKVVTPETFEIAGNWVLLESWTNKPATFLDLPDNFAAELKDFRLRVVQKGKGVTDDRYQIGDEVFVEKSRCNPIFLGSKEYCFIEKGWIFGVNRTEETEVCEKDVCACSA